MDFSALLPLTLDLILFLEDKSPRRKFYSMSFKKILFFILFFLISSFCALLFDISNARAEGVSAPTIIDFGYPRNIDGLGKFYIKGLTPANTEALVYIDGIYSDLAKTASQKTASDSFYYSPAEILTKGEHRAEIISRDINSGAVSKPAVINFKTPDPLPAPTLIKPSEKDVIGTPKPFITGLTASNTNIHIYIDGIYNGQTQNLRHWSGTADFACRPFLNLSPGWHQAWAVAENSQGQKSQISNILEFKVEPPLPAPTLVNYKTENQKLLISGLAKNDFKIRVFIDHKLYKEFGLANDLSGVANFSYVREGLTRGEHFVYTTAMDGRGKVSPWSNIIYFDIKIPEIARGARETSPQNLAAILEEADKKIKAETGAKPVIQAENSDLNLSNDLAAGEIEKVRPAKDKSPEKEENNRAKLNLVIFAAFLAGIIAWIYWVNRELGEERKREQDK